jgi:phage recombination protein Bet
MSEEYVMSSSIVKVAVQPLEFSPDQERMIRDMYLNGAPPEEAAVLLEVAKLRRLNPILKQVHFIPRWDSAKKRNVWAAQVSIDGLRVIAERTGLYEGQDEPEFEHNQAEKGRLILAKVRVYRKGWTRPAVGVAYWDEYAQQYKNQQGQWELSPMWRRMPHVMLAKCAEALALRKAFPEDTSGLYIPEEMGTEKEVTTPHSAPAPKTLPIAKRMPIVDVAPGQTEEEALAAHEEAQS